MSSKPGGVHGVYLGFLRGLSSLRGGASHSTAIGTNNERLTLAGELRVLGLEPRTHGLKGRDGLTEVESHQELTEGAPSRCSNRCTREAPASGSEPLSDRGAGAAGATELAGAALADALALIGRLPLTDAEKADAVRRLLASDAGAGR